MIRRLKRFERFVDYDSELIGRDSVLKRKAEGRQVNDSISRYRREHLSKEANLQFVEVVSNSCLCRRG